MADPHIVEELDGFDRGTILAYRTGLVVATVGLALGGGALWAGQSPTAALTGAAFGTVLSVAHLHLYDKRVRWVIQVLAWSSLCVSIVSDASPRVLGTLALGLSMAALSGLVVKEWFCFRIPGVNLTPLVLATGVLAHFLGQDEVAAVAFALGALAVGLVALAKARMPLTHDLGDRRRYQI